MRISRLLRPIFGLVLTLALGIAISVASAGASPQRVGSQSYSDPAGDANGGPDITAVTVANDASGNVTMVISVALPESSFMMVGIDNNQDGSPDRVMGAWSMGSGTLLQVSTPSNAVMAPVPSLHLTGTDTTATLTFAKGDVGIGESFVFIVATFTTLEAAEASDFAGPYGYTLAAAPPPATTTAPAPAPVPAPAPAPAVVKPVIAAPVASPRVAFAGKRLSVTFLVTRSDTGKLLTSGRMICDPSIAGKVITHVESFKAGKAKLSFLVPKTAHGKQLRVKVTIRAGTQSATRIAMFRVR